MADRSVSFDVIARDEATASLARIGEELAKLGREIKEASGSVKVDADTARADEKLNRTKRDADKLDGKDAKVKVNVDNAMALAKIQAVAAALAALGVLAMGAIGGLVGVGAVVAGGMGVALGAVSGVGDAVKALGAQTASAGGSASQAADQIRRANEQVTASTVELSKAVRDEKVAQQDLTKAREDAARKLQDLQTQTEDMALQQKQAALDVAQAKAEADAIANDPTKTLLEKQQAQLTYQEKLQQQRDLGIQAQQLAQDKAAADKAGVEGSDQVQQAQRRLQDATQAVTDAQIHLKDAQIAAAQAGQQAAGGGAAAANTLAQAMANLSPAGQEFARFMRTFIDGPLKQLRFAAQEGFLPGIESGLKRLGPIMGPLTKAVGQFAGTLGKALGDLIPIAGKLAVPFLHLADAALKGLAPLQPILDTFATQLGGVFDKLAASGQVQKMMEGLTQVIGALLPLLPELIQQAVPIAATLFPALAQVAHSLVQALGPIIAQLPALAQVLAQVLVALTPLLPPLGQLIAAIGGELTRSLQKMLPYLPSMVQSLALILQAVTPLIQMFLRFESSISIATAAIASVLLPWIDKGINLIGRLAGAGRDAMGALQNIASGVEGPFRDAMNGIASAWNNTLGGLQLPSWLGGFSVPNIPHLAAGGVATRPTLALIGEGSEPEAVVPLSRFMGQTGGGQIIYQIDVHVQNAMASKREIVQGVTEAFQSTAAGSFAHKGFRDAIGAASK